MEQQDPRIEFQGDDFSLDGQATPEGSQAQPVLCVNLCETTPPHVTASDVEDLVVAACQDAGFPYCERLYVGSYFCENYFLHLTREFHEAVRDVCARYEMQATLIVPILGQAFLERAESRLVDVLLEFADVYDEVIVNDVGEYVLLARWFAGEDTRFSFGEMPGYPASPESASPRLGLGRLFSKELRDARYDEVFQAVAHPGISAEAEACLVEQQRCCPGARPLVEVDPVATTVDVSGVMQAVQGVSGIEPEIAIHLPYCYATTGRNCGPASADEPEQQKFRLGRGCSQHCLRMDQGCLTDEGVRYLKHGRTFYFQNPACNIAGAASWRIVYALM